MVMSLKAAAAVSPLPSEAPFTVTTVTATAAAAGFAVRKAPTAATGAGAVTASERGMAARVEKKLKLLIIGDSAVGKSCLLLRFAENSFEFSFVPTIGVDFKTRSLAIDGEAVKVSMWDTAGQERFRTITEAYYRGAHGIILAYDITSQSSFNNVHTWIRSLEQHGPDRVARILVGNKADLEYHRVISKEQGRHLAQQYGMEFFETSAKADINVEEAFVSLATIAKRRRDQEEAERMGIRTHVNVCKLTEPNATTAITTSSCCA